jgi:hypothetical protein
VDEVRTAQFSRTAVVGGALREVPGSLVHAKSMGSIQTACGQTTTTWFKFWDHAFDPTIHDACPACTTTLAAYWKRVG